MRRLLALIVVGLLVVGCRPGTGIGAGGGTFDVNYVHDDAHGVGCWLGDRGMSCIPDSEYRR